MDYHRRYLLGFLRKSGEGSSDHKYFKGGFHKSEIAEYGDNDIKNKL